MYELLENKKLITFPCEEKESIVKEWQLLTRPVKIGAGKNTAVLCGAINNRTVVDIDKKHDGIEMWDELEFQFGDPITLTVRTPSGGFHKIFNHTSLVKTGKRKFKIRNSDGSITSYGIDVRNEGGYALAPPSKGYEYINDDPITDMPEWLIEALTIPFVYDEDGNLIPSDEDDKTNTTKVKRNFYIESDDFDEAIFRKVLFGLKPERADEYEDWLKVCLAVGGMAKEHDVDLSDILDEWSQQSDKYDSRATLKAYNGANRKLGYGTLWYMLKEDNPTLFAKLQNKQKSGSESQDVVLTDGTPQKEYIYDDYIELIEMRKAGELTVEIVKDFFRQVIALVINDSKHIIFTKGRRDGQIEWNQSDKNFPKFKLNNFEVDKKITFKNVFDDMLNNNEIRTYSHVVFKPYLIPPEDSNDFNVFKPYPFKFKQQYSQDQKEIDCKIVEPFVNHIKQCLCGNDDKIYNYYIDILAHLIQKPYEKPEIMMILCTKEGKGKDLINSVLISRTIGEWNVCNISNISELTRKFNMLLADKLWVVMAEANEFSEKSNMDKSKDMMTAKKINIEPKGKDPYSIASFQRFIAHSNHIDCIAPSVNDRRFVVVANWEAPESREYYNNLVKLIYDDKVVEAWFDYLSHRDISAFNPKIIPETKIKKELAFIHLPSSQRFLVEFAKEMEEDEIKIHKTDLYQKYVIWCDAAGERLKQKRVNFYTTVQRLLPEETRFRYNGSEKKSGWKMLKQELITNIKNELKIEL